MMKVRGIVRIIHRKIINNQITDRINQRATAGRPYIIDKANLLLSSRGEQRSPVFFMLFIIYFLILRISIRTIKAIAMLIFRILVI